MSCVFLFEIDCKKPSRRVVAQLKKEVKSINTPTKPRGKSGNERTINIHSNISEYMNLLSFLEEEQTNLSDYWIEHLENCKHYVMSEKRYQEYLVHKQNSNYSNLENYFRLTPLFSLFLKEFTNMNTLGYISVKIITDCSSHIFQDVWYSQTDALKRCKKAFSSWVVMVS